MLCIVPVVALASVLYGKREGARPHTALVHSSLKPKGTYCELQRQHDVEFGLACVGAYVCNSTYLGKAEHNA
jgi:hypothetical protein